MNQNLSLLNHFVYSIIPDNDVLLEPIISNFLSTPTHPTNKFSRIIKIDPSSHSLYYHTYCQILSNRKSVLKYLKAIPLIKAMSPISPDSISKNSPVIAALFLLRSIYAFIPSPELDKLAIIPHIRREFSFNLLSSLYHQFKWGEIITKNKNFHEIIAKFSSPFTTISLVLDTYPEFIAGLSLTSLYSCFLAINKSPAHIFILAPQEYSFLYHPIKILIPRLQEYQITYNSSKAKIFASFNIPNTILENTKLQARLNPYASLIE